MKIENHFLRMTFVFLTICSMLLSNIQPVQAASKAKVMQVTSKEQLVKKIYSSLLEKESTFSFKYDGNWEDLYQNDLDKTFAKVYAINDSATSDDYDYMKGNIDCYSLKISSDGITSVFTFTISYLETKTQTNKVNDMVNSTLKSLKLNTLSDYAKVKKIHNYIVNRVQYDQQYKKYTAYDAMVNKKAVCQGYALLFYKMATEAGIPCRIVASSTHAWNIVKMGKKWYHVDVTWDDPVGKKPVLRYDYFLKGTKSMNKEHNLNAEFKTASFKKNFPISDTDYKK